ncbi:MAG: 4'-phosphopantetheinyl transferase superfamily protein, partial [Solirubrobacterales bacterium]|nr:4'-phosphopantetheinyl transferase superfamily protein [Solirubrobacterales bacterium]
MVRESGAIGGWRAPPARPRVGRRVRLREGELHVWLADLDREQAPPTGLSRVERERAAKIVDERRRARWVRSRATLRGLLGAYLGTDGREVELEVADGGKPMIARPAGPARAGSRAVDLRFSLSHSGGRALYALAWGAEVGVDVERAREGRLEERALAARAWGEAVADELGARERGERRERFLRRWAAREAEIKCVGRALGGSPRDGGARGGGGRGGLWLAELDLGGEGVGAVAM